MPAAAETPLRVATYTVNLHRDGPGLLLRDITRDEPDIVTTARVIAHIAPDVLLLTGFDYDAGGAALAAYAEVIAREGGPDYAHRAAVLGNTGRPTGLDVDGDGRLGGPGDAHGFGRFSGQRGLAVLSVEPLATPETTGIAQLWSDTSGATRPEGTSDAVWTTLRLMERGGWSVRVDAPQAAFDLWAAYATPPVFDGPEDRNGLRNAAQLAYWADRADGARDGPVVLAGDLNNDPEDGEGLKPPLRTLLNHPFFIDPRPESVGAETAGMTGFGALHSGPHRYDTVDWSTGPGNLRVDYVLPSRHWRVVDAGVFWPAPDAPLADMLGKDRGAVTRHRLVWVDLVLER